MNLMLPQSLERDFRVAAASGLAVEVCKTIAQDHCPRLDGSRLLFYHDLGNRGHEDVSKPSDLVQGTLDILLLKILALEPLHGWAISQRLKQVSANVLQVSDGSLYPALHKLEQEGWIKGGWKVTENGRRAKFYSLTRAGYRALERE